MKEIMQKYQAGVKKIIKNFTGSYNEDLEQEVYIRTWRNLEKYHEQNKFRQWIHAIASNLCRDYLKTSKKYTKLSFDTEITQEIKDKKTLQDEALESKHRQKRILQEIKALPPKLKQTIIYYELEEKSYEEISTMLNVPVGTIKSRLHNARDILRERLQDLI